MSTGIKETFGYGFQHQNAFGDKFDGRSVRRRAERAAAQDARAAARIEARAAARRAAKQQRSAKCK